MRAEIMMMKPGVNARGFVTAVKDYTEPAVVEELAANSYDADASTVMVLLDPDKNQLHVVDDGGGFTRSAIVSGAILGGGEKSEADFSYSKRPYLGAYGFGLKATLNIAHSIEIQSVSEDARCSVIIDWRRLDQELKPDGKGYELKLTPRKQRQATGSHLTMALKNPTRDVLDQYLKVLGNLPEDGGRCRYYVGLLSKVRREAHAVFDDFGLLQRKARDWSRRKLVLRSEPSSEPDLKQCEKVEIDDKEDNSVKTLIYFAGLDGDKVRPLKKGLRGIYVRIHGRLLKQSFDDQRYVYGISKWVKFASGIRVELTIDWLRNEISLSREGLAFTNPKLQEQFAKTVARNISAFIQPQLKQLERRTEKHTQRRYTQRMELARSRSRGGVRGLRLRGITGGFPFKPETDGELALLIANPEVLRKVGRQLSLLDYNDQAPFDCMLYDSSRREFICCELEPTLVEFTSHKNTPEELQLVITWTLGKWRIGAKKRGVKAVYQLNQTASKKLGWYKLLSFPRENARKPSRDYDVVVLDELIKIG